MSEPFLLPHPTLSPSLYLTMSLWLAPSFCAQDYLNDNASPSFKTGWVASDLWPPPTPAGGVPIVWNPRLKKKKKRRKTILAVQTEKSVSLVYIEKLVPLFSTVYSAASAAGCFVATSSTSCCYKEQEQQQHILEVSADCMISSALQHMTLQEKGVCVCYDCFYNTDYTEFK